MARSCCLAQWHRAISLVVLSSVFSVCAFFFLVFLYFGFWDVFGCDVGHFKALALILIDVYVGGK